MLNVYITTDLPILQQKVCGTNFCIRFQEHFRDYKYMRNKSKFAQHLLENEHPLHSAHIGPPDSPASQQLQQDRNHRQWNAVRPPDDGRKDARNMLRNNWLPMNHYSLHLFGSCLYLRISINLNWENYNVFIMLYSLFACKSETVVLKANNR